MHRKKLLVAAALPFALTGGIGLIPTTARATVSAQAGTACAPTKADASKLNYSRQWGIFNDSTSSGKTVCPFIYEPEDFEEFTHAEIRVFDQHATVDTSCQLAGLNFDGTIGFSAGTQKTSGQSTQMQYLNWFSLPLWIENYNALCTLPAANSGKQSRIVSYVMGHFD